LNLAGTEYTLESKSFDIFVSGCDRACPGCFNPEAQDFYYGDKFYFSPIIKKIRDYSSFIDNIRIMGGDLLCQEFYFIIYLPLILKKNFPNKKLWLFTGAEFEEVPKLLLGFFDVIKTGRYMRELATNGELASSNQRYYYKGVNY